MRILLPIPRNGLPEEALSLCAATASARGASVRVLYVVDAGGIERTGAGAPIGAIHLAGEAARALGEKEEGAGERFVEQAVEHLAAFGIPSAGEVREGDPHDEILVEAAAADLLVSSIGSHYAFHDRDRPGALVLRLMADRVLPVLLAGRCPEPVRTVVVGCDGGPHSLRAVEAMARLSLFREGRVLLAASHRETAECHRRISGAREILAEAGYGEVEEHHLPPPKGDSFPAFCAARGAQAVVLGGWGEHRWDDLLGLSLTGRVLKDGRHHLFLFM